MNKNIFCGRGYKLAHREIMDLINLCFGCTAPDKRLDDLLPKCYREQYRPQDSNYVIIDGDGNLTATVGAYDHEIMVCGHRIPCRGIGNVGVHPDHRGRGYMKETMNKSLEDMIADGIELSTLGGRRQRYRYFGYDKAGPMYHFQISADSIRHNFGASPVPFTVREVTDPADPVIDDIRTLNAASPFTPFREREKYLDIANTWKCNLLVFSENGRFVGYCIKDTGNNITEVQVVCPRDFMGLVLSLYGYIGGSYAIHLPAYQHDYAADLAPVAENMLQNCAMHFNILNYRLVTEAFLALKLTYTTLPDGELSFLIHGYAGDERIRISVKDGKSTVEPIPETVSVDFELSHLEAIEFLYSPICPRRESSCDLVKLWFPLPLCMYRADEV